MKTWGVNGRHISNFVFLCLLMCTHNYGFGFNKLSFLDLRKDSEIWEMK